MSLAYLRKAKVKGARVEGAKYRVPEDGDLPFFGVIYFIQQGNLSSISMLGGKTFFLCHLFIFMKKLETGTTITLQLEIIS